MCSYLTSPRYPKIHWQCERELFQGFGFTSLKINVLISREELTNGLELGLGTFELLRIFKNCDWYIDAEKIKQIDEVILTSSSDSPEQQHLWIFSDR